MIRPGLNARRYSLAVTALFTLISLPALMVHANGPKPPSTSKTDKSKAVPARSSARLTNAVKPTKSIKPAVKPMLLPNSAPKSGTKYPVKVAAGGMSVKHVRILPVGFDKPPSATTLTALTNGPVEIVAAGKGRINYDVGIVKAVGLGAVKRPSLSKSRGQDVLEAREAAIADAIRILSMTVSEVRVTSETRVKNFVLEQDDIRLKVAEYIHGAEIIEEKLLGEVGIYRVVVQIHLTGPGSLQEMLAPSIAALTPKPLATPDPAPKPDPLAPGMPAPDDAEYTSLIVDCRGLKVNACMSPKVYSADGTEVYGTMKISADYVIETGIAAFPRSMEQAHRSSRAGSRPLIVRAQRVADHNRFYPVISKRDAERARAANESSHFFERTAVILVVDPIDD